MFRAHVLIIRRSKLHYAASGIITPTGVKQTFCASSWLITEMHSQQNVKTTQKLFPYISIHTFFVSA